MTTAERERLSERPVTAALTARDRRLTPFDTVADATALFHNESVQVLPVVRIDGRYLGAVDRASIDHLAPALAVVEALDENLLPVARAGATTGEALAALDRHGGTRLVVVEDDGVTYRGLVCLRSDRVRLCVDSECHEPE